MLGFCLYVAAALRVGRHVRAAGRLRALFLACTLALSSDELHAQSNAVPIALQVELLARLLWYERTLQKTTDKSLGLLIVQWPQDPESARTVDQLTAQLARTQDLGGKSFEPTVVRYESAAQLARLAEQQRPYLIYFSRGLGRDAVELAQVLRGRALLTVSAESNDVAQGIVLGFELASSKPRILLHLAQARAQQLDFSAQFLRVVRVLP
ncbi:MAG: YfiR family protein [Polyangiales bacterium]